MHKSKKHQRGISLYIVIIIVLLSMLLALWGSRTAIFNEMIVGNDADYQRAYEAAQAMIQDAELDIQNKTATGVNCTSITGRICRSNTGAEQIITSIPEMQGFSARLELQPEKCINGLCSKRIGVQDFWKNPTTMDNMIAGTADDNTNVAARYGQYTGATASSTSNPILNETDAERGAWYWIEIIKHSDEPSSSEIGTPLIYRITAIARGMKPSTQVVLQSVFAFPSIDN